MEPLHPGDQPIELQQLEPRLSCSVVFRLTDGELQVTVADPEVVFKDAVLVSGKNSDARGAETSRETLSTPFELAFDDRALEVIVFRSDHEAERPDLPLVVLDAINAVRQSDTPEARAVLSDTLEGAGAVAEAEFVRVEAAAQATASRWHQPGSISSWARLPSCFRRAFESRRRRCRGGNGCWAASCGEAASPAADAGAPRGSVHAPRCRADDERGVANAQARGRADAGAVISASHNPYQDSGIKFFWRDGFTLPDETETKIEQLIFEKSLDALRLPPSGAPFALTTRWAGTSRR